MHRPGGMRRKLYPPILILALALGGWLAPSPAGAATSKTIQPSTAAAAASFTLSLPAGSRVTIDSPSRLVFEVRSTDAAEGLSRITLRFPSGYRALAGSPPPGWTAEPGPEAGGQSAEITFRTSDEAKCTGAIAPGRALVFGVEVVAPASRSVSPDSLVSAQGEQSCRGVALDPPAELPSWDRVGIEVTLAAGPPILGVGGTVTVTMSVTSRSTVDLTDISALLSPTGTGGVRGVAGPTPGNLALAPGASGTITWTGHAVSPGMLTFSGQAVSKNVTSPPVRSDTLRVADLDVSLSVTPEQVVSGQDVRVQITGAAGETYAFSGQASAELEGVASANSMSNRRALAQQDVASWSVGTDASPPGGWGVGSAGGGTTTSTTSTTESGQASGGGGTPVASTGASVPPAVPSATLQFIGVSQDGKSTGGTDFSGGVLRYLRILVGWQNLSGSHTQRLQFFAPDGSLYQGFSTQLGSSAPETQLPVGGTWISEFSLWGAWRVEVFLDSGMMPITTGVFVLIP